MTGRQTNVIDSNMQLLLVKDSFYNIRCLPFMKNRHNDSYIVQKRLDLLKYLKESVDDCQKCNSYDNILPYFWLSHHC